MNIKIGELAKLASCPVVTIRFYEKKGLMRKPRRGNGNFRLYDGEDIERLRFIKHCRTHGMSLAEIGELLAYRDNPERECGFVHEIIDRHLVEVEKQIKSMRKLQSELLALKKATRCEGTGGCAIISALNEADDCSYCRDLKNLLNAAPK